MKKIILTGGGTAGHITPNIALLPALKEAGFDIKYIGSKKGMEAELIKAQAIPYEGISSGKLRRYFDLKNFSDPFRVLKGLFEAKKIIKNYAPNIVFSKGGFVSVPVVMAAAFLKIPVIIHESDITPGLANKIASKFATKICTNFPETLKYLPKNKAILTGSPIRQELLNGDKEAARKITGFDDKPTLLIIGGSLGSVIVNTAIRKSLDDILKEFNIIHICGKGNVDENLLGKAGYLQYEYVDKELKDFFALSDIVVSRAGANTICELLALRKPNLLIPLSGAASRGDQILNAESFENSHYSKVIEEESLPNISLSEEISELYKNREEYISAMSRSDTSNGVENIINLIKQYS